VTIGLYKTKPGNWNALIKKKEKLPDFGKNKDADPGESIMQVSFWQGQKLCSICRLTIFTDDEEVVRRRR
jgi:hypothetical protein